jgi:hypothetical protein
MGGQGWLTRNDPQLPEHDEGTTDPSWGHLGRVDRDSCVFGADSDAHDESDGEEGLPRVGEPRGDRGRSKTSGGDEDLSSSAKVVVQRVDDECSADRSVGLPQPEVSRDSHETSGEEDDGVDSSDDPRSPAGRLVETELLGEGQVGSV